MRWTKTNIIREVVATGGPPPCGALEELPGVDLAQLEAKAVRMEQDAAQNAGRYGVGVTEQAQDCYDALSKTMAAEPLGRRSYLADGFIVCSGGMARTSNVSAARSPSLTSLGFMVVFSIFIHFHGRSRALGCLRIQLGASRARTSRTWL